MKTANTQFWGVVGIGLLSLGAVSSYQGQTVFSAATITTLTATTGNITTVNATTVNATNVNATGIIKAADGTTSAPSISFTSAPTVGMIVTSSSRGKITSNNTAPAYWDSDLFHVRPTNQGPDVFAVGTNAVAYWQVDTTNGVYGVVTGSAQMPINATKTGTLYFCGLGPNSTTPVYMTPTQTLAWGGASAGDATACNAGSNATEATADKPMYPFLINPVTMSCGMEDVATDAGGVTFSLRSATADVGTSMQCTTGALDGSGHVDCDDVRGAGQSKYSIAAGATIAMKAVATAGNESTSNMFCVLTYSWQ